LVTLVVDIFIQTRC